MIEIITAMCILPVNITSTYRDAIVTQCEVMDSSDEYWTVNCYNTLKEGGYNMKLNPGFAAYKLHNHDCLVVK